jgi:hypothetical protein
VADPSSRGNLLTGVAAYGGTLLRTHVASPSCAASARSCAAR